MAIYLMIIAVLVVGVVTFILGWMSSKKIGQGKVANAERLAENIIAEANRTSETIKKEKLLEVKDEWKKLKQNFENETKTRRNEIMRLEKQLNSHEINMVRKVDLLNTKDKDL